MSAHGTRSRYAAGCRCDECREANRVYCAAVHGRLKEEGREDPRQIPHGTVGGYTNWGCRCGRCTRSHDIALDEQRRARQARMAAGSPDVPHGTPTGYRNWSCRCDDCKAAESEYQRRWRAAKRGAA